MSDKITKAREFFKSYLEKNNTTVGEHSAVSAMAEYLDEYSNSPSKFLPTETPEYKALHEKLETETGYHVTAARQRDENHANLQKANVKIAELENKLAALTKIKPTSETPVSGSK